MIKLLKVLKFYFQVFNTIIYYFVLVLLIELLNANDYFFFTKLDCLA